MKKIGLLFIFLSYSSTLFAQINLDIKNKRVVFFREIEIKNNSALVKDSSIYINDEDIGQPVIYKRKQNLLPDLLVYYFPLKKDSTISYILYEWQDVHSQVKSWSEIKPYIEKYTELLNLVTSTYGKSKSNGDLADTSLIEKTGLTRSDEWKNDTADVKMYITISNKHVVQANMEINPTYRIRLYVNAPAKHVTASKLSKEKIDALDTAAKLFISDISAGKFDDSRQYIAASVRSQVKNEQLSSLKDALKTDKWRLDMSGMQFTSSGKAYVNLRYSRLDDTNKPPREVLSILFDEDDKIVAVQPLTRMAGQ